MDAKTAENIIHAYETGDSTHCKLLVMLAGEWLAHDRQVEALQKMLHDLTPMGSDFVGQPEKCAKWVEDHMSKLTTMLVAAKGEVHELQEQNYLAAKEITRLQKESAERWAEVQALSGALNDH